MRQPDWRARLAAYLQSVESRPFSWARHSCLSFVAGAVVAMTDEDPWVAEREKVARLRRRDRVLKHMTTFGGTLRGALDRLLADVGAVRRVWPGAGDVVLVRIDGVDTCGLCTGRQTAFAGDAGVVYTRPSRILTIWHIP